MNAVLNALKERRSCRKFQPRQVSPEDLDAILEADCFCAVGSDRKIREHEDMFITTEALF